MLGLSTAARAAPRPGQPMPQQAFGAARFLLPAQQCEFQLTGILESLQRDPWPVANDKRPLRCTGVALSVAVGLLEVSIYSTLAIDSSGIYPPRRHTPTRGHASCSLRVDRLLRALEWS